MHGLMIVVPVLALLCLFSCLQSSSSLSSGPLPSNADTDPYITHKDRPNDNNFLLGRKWESSMFEGRRHKRRAGRNPCRMIPQYVNFTAMGWDWVFFPPGYYSYNCVGECHFPMPAHLNGTSHAALQGILHSINPSAVASPCCVPMSYSPITVVTVEQGDDLVKQTLPDMVVKSCGCR